MIFIAKWLVLMYISLFRIYLIVKVTALPVIMLVNYNIAGKL